MAEPDVEAIRLYFARTAPPPRGHQYFADLCRRIAAAADTRQQPDSDQLPAAHGNDYGLRWQQVAQHRERLLRLARTRTRTLEDAEDIVHEAMLRCVTFENLEAERVGQFLTVVTVRLCADFVRSQEGAISVSTTGPDVDRAHQLLVLARMLDALPTRQREILTMCANGNSVEDIASRQRMSYKAVEHALERARSTLAAAVLRSTDALPSARSKSAGG
jgi:RNA polymerase sigma factor (sigma-70 family)